MKRDRLVEVYVCSHVSLGLGLSMCGNQLSGLSALRAWEMLQAEIHLEVIKTGIHNGRERKGKKN